VTPSALPVLDAHALVPRRPLRPLRPSLSVVRDAPLLRAALPSDVVHVHEHLQQFVGPGVLLPRSEAQVTRDIADFTVAVEGAAIVGTVALRTYSAELAEIGALAVAPHLQGTGVGRRLVEAAVTRARTAGLHRVFALTLEEGFFQRLGFVTTDIAAFPQKIAADCSTCGRRPTCAERAVVLVLQ
jgi:N-acetylglutamate synthase-like GNAT family acetyltransferase